eukprot:1188706-Prorocentrum_minimum.AAC.2
MLRTSSRFPGRHVYRTLRNLWSRGSPGAPAAHHGETQELLTHYLLSYCVALVRFLLGLLNRSCDGGGSGAGGGGRAEQGRAEGVVRRVQRGGRGRAQGRVGEAAGGRLPRRALQETQAPPALSEGTHPPP